MSVASRIVDASISWSMRALGEMEEVYARNRTKAEQFNIYEKNMNTIRRYTTTIRYILQIYKLTFKI